LTVSDGESIVYLTFFSPHSKMRSSLHRALVSFSHEDNMLPKQSVVGLYLASVFVLLICASSQASGQATSAPPAAPVDSISAGDFSFSAIPRVRLGTKRVQRRRSVNPDRVDGKRPLRGLGNHSRRQLEGQAGNNSDASSNFAMGDFQ
jgi:hypothetical protein